MNPSVRKSGCPNVRTATGLRVAAVFSSLLSLMGAEVLHLRQDEAIPADAIGSWLRLADGATISLRDGDQLRDLPPGVYRSGTRRLALRASNTAADWAASLVGLRSANFGNEDERRLGVEQLIAVDPFALVIHAWRRADGLDWPWVGHGLTTGGLLGLATTQVALEDAAHYDPALGAYAIAGEPITFGADAIVALGDVVVARPAHALLVADLGVRGLLDPEDEVVVSLPTADHQVRRIPLGELAGRSEFAVWRRDPARIIAPTPRSERTHHLSDNIDQLSELPAHRQWMAAAGMVLICAALLRMIWRRRRG